MPWLPRLQPIWVLLANSSVRIFTQTPRIEYSQNPISQVCHLVTDGGEQKAKGRIESW